MARAASPACTATRAKNSIEAGAVTASSRSDSQPLLFPLASTRRPCHRDSCQSERGPREGYDFPVVLSGKIQVRCVLVASFPGRHRGRRQRPASSLTKISVPPYKNPALDQPSLLPP